MYDIVISSPASIGISALSKAFLLVKTTMALGVQEWLAIANAGSKKIPAWPISASILSKAFV